MHLLYRKLECTIKSFDFFNSLISEMSLKIHASVELHFTKILNVLQFVCTTHYLSQKMLYKFYSIFIIYMKHSYIKWRKMRHCVDYHLPSISDITISKDVKNSCSCAADNLVRSLVFDMTNREHV